MEPELWSKRPTYEEVRALIDRDYTVKLPNKVALEFYDSFAMSQFRADQAMADEHGGRAGEHRDEAMREAAAEAGMGKQELLQFAQQMHQQSLCANEQLRRELAETAAIHQRGMQ